MTSARFGDLDYFNKDILDAILTTLSFEDLLTFSVCNKRAREHVLALPKVASTMRVLSFLNENMIMAQQLSKSLYKPSNRLRFFSQIMNTNIFEFIIYLSFVAWLSSVVNIILSAYIQDIFQRRFEQTLRAVILSDPGSYSEFYYRDLTRAHFINLTTAQQAGYHSAMATMITSFLLILFVAGNQYSMSIVGTVADLADDIDANNELIADLKNERDLVLRNYYKR